MRKWFLGLAASLTVLSSCSEDVDLTAPYKDLAIVYGLLDEKQDTHWVRIQKAFLGDDNALLYSVIPDSLYYNATLVAWIQGYTATGTKVDSFPLQRMVNAANKDSGIFAAFNNVLYRGVYNINPNSSYKLFVKKPNGDTITSETVLAKSVTMGYPLTSTTPLDFEPDNILFPEEYVKFRWTHDSKSYGYQLALRFNYQEWTGANPPVDTSFLYYFPLFRPTNEYQCLTNQICYQVSKSQFYGMIVNHIEKDPPGTPGANLRLRRFLGLDVIVLQATEEFYNYITINAPSLSYVQKVTSYTNVEGGLGIFGSRTTAGFNNVPLNTQTLDSLRLGQHTWELNFQP